MPQARPPKTSRAVGGVKRIFVRIISTKLDKTVTPKAWAYSEIRGSGGGGVFDFFDLILRIYNYVAPSSRKSLALPLLPPPPLMNMPTF